MSIVHFWLTIGFPHLRKISKYTVFTYQKEEEESQRRMAQRKVQGEELKEMNTGKDQFNQYNFSCNFPCISLIVVLFAKNLRAILT